MLRIAIIADFDPAFEPHLATDAALQHATAAAGHIDVRADWIATPTLRDRWEERLAGYQGIVVAPGSPYKSLQGGINAIRFARECGRPLLANCGGFQHVVIEYARHVLGFADAQHAEYDPYASRLFVSALRCSLAGRVLPIDLAAGSRARAIYGSDRVEERYYCNFGLNRQYRAAVEQAGLAVTGTEAGDEPSRGEARILELPSHPFYIATLFVPQMMSTPQRPHPMFVAFLRAAGSGD